MIKCEKCGERLDGVVPICVNKEVDDSDFFDEFEDIYKLSIELTIYADCIECGHHNEIDSRTEEIRLENETLCFSPGENSYEEALKEFNKKWLNA